MQTPGRINQELRCHTCSMVAKGIILRMEELRKANKGKVSTPACCTVVCLIGELR